jgi:hypothetical protein
MLAIQQRLREQLEVAFIVLTLLVTHHKTQLFLTINNFNR